MRAELFRAHEVPKDVVRVDARPEVETLRLALAEELRPASVSELTDEEILDLADRRARDGEIVFGVRGRAPAQLPSEPEKPKEKTAPAKKKVDLWIRLDLDPSEAGRFDDRFTVESTDGSYTSTKTVADDKIPGDRHLDLEYKDLDPDKSYSLKVEEGGGTPPYFVFQGVPYEELADLSPSVSDDDAEDEPAEEAPGEDDPYPEPE